VICFISRASIKQLFLHLMRSISIAVVGYSSAYGMFTSLPTTNSSTHELTSCHLEPQLVCRSQTTPYTEIVRHVAEIDLAITQGDQRYFNALMENNIHRNLVAPHSWQFLKKCIEYHDLLLMRQLILLGADPGATNPTTGEPLLLHAAYVLGDNPEILELLHEHGAEIPHEQVKRNPWYISILPHLVREGKLHKARFLIGAGLPIDGIPQQPRHTPLLEALYTYNPDALDLLLQHGADPNRKTPHTGQTPLISLCRVANHQLSTEMAQLLLKHDATDLFIHDNYGRSAYENARYNVQRRRGISAPATYRKCAATQVYGMVRTATIKRLIQTFYGLRAAGVGNDVIKNGVMPFLGRFCTPQKYFYRKKNKF